MKKGRREEQKEGRQRRKERRKINTKTKDEEEAEQGKKESRLFYLLVSLSHFLPIYPFFFCFLLLITVFLTPLPSNVSLFNRRISVC